VAEVLTVLSTSKESFNSKFLEPTVRLRLVRVCGVLARHDSDHFGCEFEGCAFEFDTARCDVKAETKVNVDDVAGVVNHDVAVVAVFELEEETDD
jgi:hypothetical protein